MRRGPVPQVNLFNEHHVVVFDIETVVDDEPADGSFPPWPRHRPVAAAFLTARWSTAGYNFSLDTLMCAPGAEDAFYGKVDKLLPAGATGVTYAGRSFDNLVLSLQAMRWRPGFDLTGLARQANAGRYGGAHCDLADQIAGQGATRPVQLVELCRALDIPAKVSASGGEVGELWRAGEHARVRAYVREDVVGTYMLWLHWIAFQKSKEELLTLPLAQLAAWIEREPGLAHLMPFAECRPALLARARAPALLAKAALVDAARRAQQERDEAAFVAGAARPF